MAVLLLFATAPALIGAQAAGEIVVFVDGQPVFFPDQGPVNVSGHALVPARGVFEALGFATRWEGHTQTATLLRHDYTIILTVGSQTFTTNGVTFHLEEPVQLISGRVMLSPRLPLESIGYSFDWGQDVSSMFIASPLAAPSATPPPHQQAVVFRPVIPPGGYLEHFIEPGQSLASIAQIYWPHNPETPTGRLIRDNLIAHIVQTNNIANPEVIFAGVWLRIYEHPQIEQVFD